MRATLGCENEKERAGSNVPAHVYLYWSCIEHVDQKGAVEDVVTRQLQSCYRYFSTDEMF
jgi:hypothetical protein